MDNEFVRQGEHTNTNVQADSDSLWDKFWRDKHGDVVIVQMPNIWLAVWLILEVVSLLAASHKIEEITWWLASGALGIWSLLEIFRGANYFRRFLGVCIALLTLSTIVGL